MPSNSEKKNQITTIEVLNEAGLNNNSSFPEVYTKERKHHRSVEGHTTFVLVDAIGRFGDPYPSEIGAKQIQGFDCHRDRDTTGKPSRGTTRNEKKKRDMRKREK